MHGFILETERLILRPLTVDDCDAVYRWVSDPEVARYMVYNTYTSGEALREWLESLGNDEEYHFGYELKETGDLVGAGSIGPRSAEHDRWAFGYNLRRDCWGKGYATEAAKAMIRFAHEQFGITKFACSHVEQNKASGHVIEKCGLHFVRYGQFTKLDGTCPMRSMEYEGDYRPDTTAKFDGRAQDYAAGRPGYAGELIDCMYARYGLAESSVIADIGSGTGKFSQFLLARGSEVYCVEPGGDMRAEAEKNLGGFPNFHSVKGGAEDTTLPDSSVDFVTTAQAFHWFDTAKFRAECFRILRDNGKAFLIWNIRDMDDPVNRELHKIYTEYCPDFVGYGGGIVRDDPRIREFFGGDYERVSFANDLKYDKDTFIARSLSGSYSLKEGDLRYDEYMKALDELYEKFAADGIVTVGNSSVAYIGSVN